MKKGQCGMVGIQGGDIKFLSPRDTTGKEKKIDARAHDMNAVFSM